MQQYWDIKSQHTDKILLFRMGDFYEMFFDDAVKAAPILDIALTSRNKSQGQDIPMCGVPYHSIATPINKLLKAGLKVAICEQVETPSAAKGIVKRAVTRVVTPGVIYDPDQLDSETALFVAAITPETSRGASKEEKLSGPRWNVAFADVTTGDRFKASSITEGQLQSLVDRFRPREILIEASNKSAFQVPPDTMVTAPRADLLEAASQPGAENFTESLLTSYILELQGSEVSKTLKPFVEIELKGLKLSTQTLRHLEVFETSQRLKNGSLLWAVDRTLTPMGARKLRSILASPSSDIKTIEGRQAHISWFLEHASTREQVRFLLKTLGDMERKIAKLSNPLCNARDLQALARSFGVLREISALLAGNRYKLSGAESLAQRISDTLKDELPVSVKEGGLIRPGYHPQLDEYVDLSTNGQKALSELEAREREKSGIQSLKVKYNHVFGYSIEVTNANRDKVPAHFIRKQTLANAERFVTEELMDLERKILSAEQKRCDLENQIFEELRRWALNQAQALFKLASEVAWVDLHAAFAELAFERDYCKPMLGCERFELMRSRHAVLEQLGFERFVPNDILLSHGECIVLTGPNMAGKSTVMRQVALITLLAHCGSYVPAQSARLPFIDQIFTRIGASDHLTAGLSTFMVEMVETSQIVSQATGNSLIVLDEIGRGTSTFDGMSLAQAILEHFATQVKAWTFFATHYQELTVLEEKIPGVKNFHMSIREYRGNLVFLRKLTPGSASKSYGIQVAQQAGLPGAITDRARQILKEIELQSRVAENQLNLFAGAVVTDGEKETKAEDHPLIDELKNLEIEGLTPLQALNKISQWQQSL